MDRLIRQMPILVRREFWENRTAFLHIPLIIAAFHILLMIGLYVGMASGFVQITLDTETGLEREHITTDNIVGAVLHKLEEQSPDMRKDTFRRGYTASSIVLVVTLWFVVFFYLLDALYSDRLDRSVLFWKSMPVSDWATVLSKLVAALILAPLLYLACVVMVHLALLVLSLFAALVHEAPLWATIIKPSSILVGIWFNFLSYFLFMALWGLPFYGWVLLCSAFARSVPFVWTAGIPVSIIVTEKLFTNDETVARWIGRHIFPGTGDNLMGVGELGSRLLSVEFVVATGVGCLLVYGAVWFRGRADEL